MSEEGSNPAGQTADTMTRRVGGSRLRLWFSMTGHRAVVFALLSVLVFAAFILVSTVLRPSLRTAIQSADTIETMFSTMLSVVVTGTTLVVTISQIILSQENGPLGDQRRRMSDAMDTRHFLSEVTGETVPSDPAALLTQLLEAIQRRGQTLRRAAEDLDDDELRTEVDDLVDSIDENADLVTENLQDSQFGTFDVLFAVLDFNYSANIHAVQRLSNEFSDSLDEETQSALTELETGLTMYAPVREHVKTLYFQWALVDLSRYILYAAIPALVVAGCMLTFVGAGSFPGTTLGVDDITLVVTGAFTVTTMPFLLFATYIFRIAVVAKRTLAIGPIILRDSAE